MKAVVWLALSLQIVSASAEESLSAAARFLEENRISQPLSVPADYQQNYGKIDQLPAPGTKFGYTVFSVARHQKKLLTAEQVIRLDKLIESRKNSPVNWHDTRNIVRVHAVIELWSYAAATEQARVDQHKQQWEKWTDLRLAYMYEEYIAKERFQRGFWEILTSEQRNQLLSGEWNQYLKKSTGHKRLYSAAKQVTRELGPPDKHEAFGKVSSQWMEKWQPMIANYWQASIFQQKREASMDFVGEDFAAESWKAYASAFKNFATMERDAIRELVQVGYSDHEEVQKKIALTHQKLRSQMIKKYQANAPGFLELLSVSAK